MLSRYSARLPARPLCRPACLLARYSTAPPPPSPAAAPFPSTSSSLPPKYTSPSARQHRYRREAPIPRDLPKVQVSLLMPYRPQLGLSSADKTLSPPRCPSPSRRLPSSSPSRSSLPPHGVDSSSTRPTTSAPTRRSSARSLSSCAPRPSCMTSSAIMSRCRHWWESSRGSRDR